MCTQVDKKWACGHIVFYRIIWCERQFKGCKGTSAHHDVVDEPDKCGDCKRRSAQHKASAPKS